MSTIVYVVNKDGKSLMPTNRNRHVRVLLQSKRARIFSRDPFTIQLLYDSPSKVQDLYLGIDPGRTNIGVTVTRETGESVFTSKLVTKQRHQGSHGYKKNV